MEFAILESLEVRSEGQLLPVPGDKQRQLLAMLLVHANEVVGSERLLEALWRRPPGSGLNALQVRVSQLRKALGAGGAALETRPSGYLLRLEPGQLDLDRFEQLASEARQAGPGEAAAKLREALALWRGPPLSEFAYEEFAQSPISRLEELRLTALERRIDADLKLGHNSELVGELEQLIAEHPLRERLSAQLMLALYRCGRQAEALAVFQDARRALLEELGLEPGPDLKTIERAILNHDPALLLESVLPPPKSAPNTNLPKPATTFLGREKELAEILDLLSREEARLLTLTGPGGTGKTRLAVRAAALAADAFPDGVWWVPLAALRDPELILPAVATIFGLSDQPGRELGNALLEALGGKRLLLALDNAEHLLPQAAEAIATLREADGPTVVVTSRERLQLAGEHVYPVPPLAVGEAVELFTARARALGSRFETTATVGELCGRLDNLPLAIELAAARMTVLSPKQILERLSQRPELLKAGRGAPPRQRTLHSTIEWSYDLLDAQERELFARLAVFTGGSTLEAVEEICDAHLDTLASLVDKSLVRHGDERFWMLETIREYAAKRLDEAADGEDIRRRHGEFYERFAGEAEEGMRTPAVLSWLDRVEREQPNLRSALGRSLERADPGSALRTAAALFRYWEARSGPSEGRTWLDQALATGAGSAGDRARGSYVAARLAFFQGDLERARALFGDAAELALLAGDDQTLAVALACSGLVHAEQGERETALALTRQGQDLAAGLTDRWARAEALLAVAAGLTITGESEGGDALNREVLAIKREFGDELNVSDILNNLGYSALANGNYDEARTLLEESLAISRRLADTFRITLALGNLGLVAVLEGRYDEAIALLDEDLRLCIMRGDRRCGTEAILGLTAAHAALGNDELALRLDAIQQGLSEAMGLVNPPGHFELLERPIRRVREELDPAITRGVAEWTGEPSLEAALVALERES